MERENRMTVICDSDGTVIQGRNEDELVRNYRKHLRETHNVELSESEARADIRENMSALGDEMDH